jgi:hypothetical protein
MIWIVYCSPLLFYFIIIYPYALSFLVDIIFPLDPPPHPLLSSTLCLGASSLLILVPTNSCSVIISCGPCLLIVCLMAGRFMLAASHIFVGCLEGFLELFWCSYLDVGGGARNKSSPPTCVGWMSIIINVVWRWGAPIVVSAAAREVQELCL